MSAHALPAGSPHTEFVAWAVAQGVEINGVQLAQIPGHGLGIVTTEPIKAGTTVVDVPTRALLTTDCLPQKFVDSHDPETTAHGLLASFLANGSSHSNEMGRFRLWQATWPTYEEFVQSLPVLWPEALRAEWTDHSGTGGFWPMPRAVGGSQGYWDYSQKPVRKVDATCLIDKQRRKLESDYEHALHAFPQMKRRDFLTCWLVVNTRSFFYDIPLRREPKSHEDNMILCPFMDYFNHADEGCRVFYNDEGYSISADRDYVAGEELFACYGAHDNDQLWVDYGFLPDRNRFDSLRLDPWILAPPTGIEITHSRRLRKAGYLDKYHLGIVDGQAEVCYRTQVAVHAATMRPGRWMQYVRGKDAAEDVLGEADVFLRDRILVPFRDLVAKSLQELDLVEDGVWQTVGQTIDSASKEQCLIKIRDSLRARWNQMKALLDEALD